MVSKNEHISETENETLDEGVDAEPWPNYDSIESDEDSIESDEEDIPSVDEDAAVEPQVTSAEGEEFDAEDDVNPNKGLPFSVPSPVPGEEKVPYRDLVLWEHHPSNGSRLKATNFDALCASASDPANLPPLTVLRTNKGIMIIDGRLRHYAIGAVHGEDSDVSVRCVFFSGTEEEAVQAVADSALGGTPRSQIEMARAILNLQRVAGISQKAIGERYPILKKDQVSRMTIAARTVERFPIVFELLAEPDRVPIDTCVKFAQFMKAATDMERAQVLESAEVRMSEGVMLKPGDLFDALGIETEGSGGKAKPSAAQDPSDVLETVDVLGFDDQPVGKIEKLDERVMRFQLPDPATMTPDEREVAARAFIAEICAYFGLKVAG
ncbi:hypothetical protein [Erythrobacter donghaensis]|jgi:hypothetical protein|uniref:hypothetical protein n=1 Tax=Erythrobacter donghaensis TaxID=267135 RepID=UPI0008355662|nr:hypothetical protein [Erythrobacter donghaensis]MBA4079880.1 hypothetical protein [Erythrobacter sp.]